LAHSSGANDRPALAFSSDHAAHWRQGAYRKENENARSADHLRCDPGLVDEDESLELRLLSLERSASSRNVRTILLERRAAFF